MNSQAFKETMSRWTSGVTVVTTIHEGFWKGVTASAFSSLSAEPPLVLICIAKKLYTHELLTKSGVFAVNILAAEQSEIAKLFAGMYPQIEDRFAGKDCFTATTGSPLLPNTLGYVDCKIVNQYEHGDHSIFIGEVLASAAHEGEPLVYHQRKWGQFSEMVFS